MLIKSQTDKIKSAADIAAALRCSLLAEDRQDRSKEHFYAIGLNAQNQILYIDCVSVGLANTCPIHPRETYRRAIEHGALALIVAHNHPGGTTYPSDSDTAATRQLQNAGKIIGIDLLDHVIFTDTEFYSYQREGLID